MLQHVLLYKLGIKYFLWGLSLNIQNDIYIYIYMESVKHVIHITNLAI
jgi:hypothetical protein